MQSAMERELAGFEGRRTWLWDWFREGAALP